MNIRVKRKLRAGDISLLTRSILLTKIVHQKHFAPLGLPAQFHKYCSFRSNDIFWFIIYSNSVYVYLQEIFIVYFKSNLHLMKS